MNKCDFLRRVGVTVLAAPTLMRTSFAADNGAGTQSGETQTAELLFVQSAEGDASSLFIDIIGRPLTPLSVGGVRRRTRRRVFRRRW